MRDLNTLRTEIDRVDRALLTLLAERMSLASEVAAYKLANGLPVLDSAREHAVIDSRIAAAGDSLTPQEVTALMELLMAQSRARQEALIAQRMEAKPDA